MFVDAKESREKLSPPGFGFEMKCRDSGFLHDKLNIFCMLFKYEA